MDQIMQARGQAAHTEIDDLMPRARAEQLLKLAVWYREYAERAGNPGIWASRIRAAERLEEEAAQMDAVARFPLPKTGERASGRAN